ncbi:substrate-binding domain-containing protein [Arthrobacter sp. zg-Y108]|nr:substrate-binding domain-containing protein [Arthrobacter zhaoxinii]
MSHQTVSRLLKGQTISPAFKLKVDKALADLNYRPNLAARSLATRQSNRIATLIYEMSELGPMKIMQSASTAARRAGYVLDIVHLDPSNSGSLSEAIAILNQLDVAGILAFAPNDITRAQLSSTEFRVPIYFEAENDDDDLQRDDRPNFNAIGAELAMSHLTDLGHRSIAHISGPLTWPAARLRVRSYRQSVSRHKLPEIPIVEGDWSARSGHGAALTILDRHPEVTAIFAANDQMALGALSALAQRGVVVPRDVSVVGMDDAAEAQFYTPSLSTVPMHFETQGQYAFEAILARIQGRDVAVKTDYVHTALVARESTGPAR